MEPASPTPLSLRIIVDAPAAAGVPAGVVNYVTVPGRMGPATVFGPSPNRLQGKSVLEHLETAKAEGARVSTGGKPALLNGELADGLFTSQPCSLTSPRTCEWPSEEFFGPALTLLK